MRETVTLLLVLLTWGSALCAQNLESVPFKKEGVVPLKVKVYRQWNIRLPQETWTRVGDGIDLEATLGRKFKAHLDGAALAVDINGDDVTDVKVEAPSGHLILSHENRRYAVRVELRNQQWYFAPAAVLVGNYQGTKLRLIDQNNNGRFNDVGEDALVIGRSRVACMLSEVVSIKGELLALRVAKDATSLELKPWQGPTSLFHVSAATRGKVTSLVLVSDDRRFSFAVKDRDVSFKVPAGSYRIHSGSLALGGNKVSVRGGRTKSVVLAAGAQGHLKWGGPVTAEFAYARQGRELKFSPKEIRYFGAAGEEYFNWTPLGKSPRILVVSKTGRQIAEAFFPGSC